MTADDYGELPLWAYENELPDDMTDEEYHDWYVTSTISAAYDVRMGIVNREVWSRKKAAREARDAFIAEMRAVMAKHRVRLRPYSWDDDWEDCFAGPDWGANVGDLADE